MNKICLDDVSFSYPVLDNIRFLKNRFLPSGLIGGRLENDKKKLKVNVLNHIQLEIKSGERVGLLGHNGSGKSTLLRLMAKIYFPDSGDIDITGRSVSLFDMISGMNMDATGLENIYLRGYMLGMDRKKIKSKIEDIIEFSELGEFIDLPLSTYSHGMFLRLAFSISTSVHPEILLIDEGIGVGDARFQEKASRRIREFTQNTNILVFSSHSQELLSLYCNRIIMIKNGRIEGENLI